MFVIMCVGNQTNKMRERHETISYYFGKKKIGKVFPKTTEKTDRGMVALLT
jgi:hypothetical protein